MLPLDKQAALRKIIAMKVSDAGIAFIAGFEGFSGHLYNDPSGNCTIGYGNLIHMGKCDGRADEQVYRNGISEGQGRAMLAAKVLDYADCVMRTTFAPLTQPQFDALVSFTYNVGTGGYINSPVRAAVNSGGDVCAALMMYVHGSDGLALPGLQRRREAECAMFKEDAMTPAEREEFDGLKAQVYSARVDLNALANGIEAVTEHNDVQAQTPRLSLKGLWYVAGKAWPF